MSTINSFWWNEGEQVGHCANVDQCGPYMKFDHVYCRGMSCENYKEKDKSQATQRDGTGFFYGIDHV